MSCASKVRRVHNTCRYWSLECVADMVADEAKRFRSLVARATCLSHDRRDVPFVTRALRKRTS